MNKQITRSQSAGKTVVHAILILGAILMVGPFIWMILTSFMSLGESTRVPPVLIPERLRWENYARVFNSFPFLRFYWNTFSTTVAKVVGQVVFCSMAAYAFARIRFPGRDFLFIVVISVLMVPSQAYVIPRYMIMMNLGWLNTLTALIVPGLTSSFGTFLLRQFFMSLPAELEEAATLDGCNHFQIYYMVFAPLAKSGLIALAIFTAMWSWNDLMWPLIVNSSPLKMTLSAGLSSLQGQYGTDFPLLMAGSLMAIFPMVLMFMFLQNHFVEGIALTGTKG